MNNTSWPNIVIYYNTTHRIGTLCWIQDTGKITLPNIKSRSKKKSYIY